MGEKKEKLDGRIVMDAHEAIRWVTDRLYVLKNILDETDRSHYSTAMEIADHLLSLSIADLEKEAMGKLEKEFNLSNA